MAEVEGTSLPITNRDDDKTAMAGELSKENLEKEKLLNKNAVAKLARDRELKQLMEKAINEKSYKEAFEEEIQQNREILQKEEKDRQKQQEAVFETLKEQIRQKELENRISKEAEKKWELDLQDNKSDITSPILYRPETPEGYYRTEKLKQQRVLKQGLDIQVNEQRATMMAETKNHQDFMKEQTDKLVTSLREDQLKDEIKKQQDIQDFSQVWGKDIKIKEMQNEIDKNLREFKIKLVEEENQRQMGVNSDAFTEVETVDEVQTIGIDTEFDDVLMTRIISDKEKGLPKQELKSKLVELCNLETEK